MRSLAGELEFSYLQSLNFDNLESGQRHTIKVRAVDIENNKDPTPDTFTWTILTPEQATQNLINTIDSMHLSRGTTTSLEAPLNAAIRHASRNNDVGACNTLDAFLHQVNAKETNGQLTSQQAADLRQQATASSLPLPPPPSFSLQSQQHLQQSPETSLITNTESSGQPSTLSLSP